MKNTKKAAVIVVAGVMLAGGALGASAFFTDQATTVNTANVGTMNMVLKDYSDLDGSYADWQDVDGVWTCVSRLRDNGLQAAKFEEDASDKDAPSAGIINPGDTGILQFSLANDEEKSYDAAAEIVLTSTESLTKGADEYSIQGLGIPVKSDDGRMLTYRMELDTINGTIETEDGGLSAEDEHYYAYNVDFLRTSANRFMDADFEITVNVYAKQHRNSPAGEFKTDTTDADGIYNTRLVATGDWEMIGSYEVSTFGGADSVNE